MRALLAFALVLVACGPSDRRDPSAAPRASSPPASGPEPIVLRIPRGGGPATAAVLPRLDSVVWRSTGRVPAPARVLAMSPEEGLVAFVDEDGRPGRLDLRLGEVAVLPKPKLTGLASVDGVFIYGITDSGAVARVAPTGETWRWTPPTPAERVLPQADGWLVVIAEREGGSMAWRLRPPEERVVDSLELPPVARAVNAGVADRIYFGVPGGLAGARVRGLEPVPTIPVEGNVAALASTPSGDRLYVLTEGGLELFVVNRYTDDVAKRVELPGLPRELRVDPLGRTLLVRAAAGDSAWVVTLADDALAGSVRTDWRADLPLVAPDGSLLLAQGKDVVIADPATLEPRARVEGGAGDFWHVFEWDGFRATAPEPEEPEAVAAEPPAPPADSLADTTGDTTAAADTVAAAPVTPPPPRADTTPRAPEPPRAPAGFTVSFATLLSEESARDLAGRIRVNGRQARVVPSQRSGVPIFRVVIGPFPTREEADEIGRASGESYWIVEGTP